MKLFDVGGNILVDEYFDGDILRARVNEGKLYIMIKGKLVIYDMKTAQRKTMTLEPRYSDFAFVSGGIVFISPSGAQYIDFYNINSAAK